MKGLILIRLYLNKMLKNIFETDPWKPYVV